MLLDAAEDASAEVMKAIDKPDIKNKIKNY